MNTIYETALEVLGKFSKNNLESKETRERIAKEIDDQIKEKIGFTIKRFAMLDEAEVLTVPDWVKKHNEEAYKKGEYPG